MRLYANHCKTFIEDCERNQISEKLRNSAKFAGLPSSPSEVQSWQNSLRALAMVFSRAGLFNQGIALEFQLPMTSKRSDCILCGFNADGQPSAVVIELKQWSKVTESSLDNEIVTFVGGRERDQLHPSMQANDYATFLRDNHEACHTDDPAIHVHACAYLHNYFPAGADPIRAPKFDQIMEEAPTFNADEVDMFVNFVRHHVGYGDGLEVLAKLEENRYRPSKKLMEHVADVIHNNGAYRLLDEQRIAFDTVLAAARPGVHNRKKQVIIIKGGPGTGKSVVAINLLAALLSGHYSAHYVTGSKAFTGTLRKIIGSRGRDLFTYSNSYMGAMPDSVDALVVDEAHRLRDVSSNRFTPKDKRSGLKKIQELFKVARVSVFLIDDHQVVRPDEIGSSNYIREYAEEANCDVHEFDLHAQFRCNGSDEYLNWLNSALGIRSGTPEKWADGIAFDFKIFETPDQVECALREKIADGSNARMTAGFCWPWSDPLPDGSLATDVVIGEYQRPWNAKDDAGKLAPGIPKSVHWAYEPEGIEQIGCIYTAQGFEFDYVGVIFGKDLVIDPVTREWRVDKTASCDTQAKRGKGDFSKLVKNVYRVLLSRGIKGCYVYFEDKGTEDYFKNLLT